MHQRQNIKHSTTAPLKAIPSSSPMEVVGLDFLHLDTCTGGFQYLLVIIFYKHFKRYTHVYRTINKEAKTAATKLFTDYILRFGTPGKILHDQGRESENKLFKHLSKLYNIKDCVKSFFLFPWLLLRVILFTLFYPVFFLVISLASVVCHTLYPVLYFCVYHLVLI